MKKLSAIFVLVCPALAAADGISVTGVEGPLLFLYAIANPLATIQALALLPAEKRKQEAFRLARTQCAADEERLPQAIGVDSFIDHGAALTSSQLNDLLFKRNVKAIYVQPQLDWNGRVPTFARTDLGGYFLLPPLPSPPPSGTTYLKLELGRLGEANCLPAEAALPDELARWSRPPALPTTCLAYSFTDDPQSQYSLRYSKTAMVAGQQFGTWSVVNLVTGESLASITTVDDPLRPMPWAGPKDCRSPYGILAGRIGQASAEKSQFSLRESIVLSTPTFFELVLNKKALQYIQPEIHPTPYRDGEWEGYTREIQRRWKAAIDEATRTGIGHFDNGDGAYFTSSTYFARERANGAGRLIDWANGSLVGLQLGATGTREVGGHWGVSASNGGFLAFQSDWKGNAGDTVVARYLMDGKLDWAVRLPSNIGPLACGAGPTQARETATEVVLFRRSCNNKAGAEFRILKRDISEFGTPNWKWQETSTQ